VVLVSRLREVRALLGYIRLSAPDRDDPQPVRRSKSCSVVAGTRRP
jgi:hypothetical protein